MHKHFAHGSALVVLDGVEFFADSASLHEDDEQVGQLLCGFALAAGQREQMLWNEFEARVHRDIAALKPRDDYELSGWNSGCAGAGI